MFISPPLLLIAAIGLSVLLSTFVPDFHMNVPQLRGMGILLIVLGVSLFFWSVYLFQKHKTTLHHKGKPTTLVTVGPYTFSRNPIYLGFLFITIGVSFVVSNILAFAGPLVFFYVISTIVIPYEEDILTKIFGTTYATYRKRIRRWV